MAPFERIPVAPLSVRTEPETSGPGPAPVRRFLPELIEKIWTRQINPGKVFDLTLPLEKAAEGYAANG